MCFMRCYITKNDCSFSNKSATLPVESRFNYVTIDISPNGSMLIAINEGKISFFCIYISRKICVVTFTKK